MIINYLFFSQTTQNSKTYQTQSLSNIAASTLTHSTSENDIDPMNLHKGLIDNENDVFIYYLIIKFNL